MLSWSRSCSEASLNITDFVLSACLDMWDFMRSYMPWPAPSYKPRNRLWESELLASHPGNFLFWKKCSPLHFAPVKQMSPFQFELPGTGILSAAMCCNWLLLRPVSRIMKPYASRHLTFDQRICKYRLSRARRLVENTFSVMCSRFPVFGQAIALSPDKVKTVIMAACCLHNYLLQNPVSASHYLPDDPKFSSSVM